MKYDKNPPIFWIAEIIMLGIVTFALLLYLNAAKPKTQLLKLKGVLTLFSKQYQNADFKDEGNRRYLQINGNKQIFEVFVGHESGDFSPKFEVIDRLHPGQLVTIYYTEPIITSNNNINRFIQFIDQNDKPIYIKGDIDKLFGAGIMEFGLVFMGVLFFLKMKRIIN